MKFKILNKNNNQEYFCDENVIITENFNETLDSANFRISHLSSKIDIEPYDRILLWDENGRFGVNKIFYFCVDTYNCIEEGLDGITYTYDISLFSETKLLEGIILPNLSITQLRVGTKRSIYWYLQRYLALYGTKIRVGTTNNYKYQSKFSLSDEVRIKFNNIICPEFQWNMPTLREVFNNLMMVADCIPVVRNNVIYYLDLTNKGKEITNYNYIQESQSSVDYTSELQLDLQNVMQTSINNVNNVVTTTEFVPFSSNDWQVTSENMVLRTQFPILNIKHLWIMVMPSNPVATNFVYLKRDLMDLKFDNGDTGGSLIKEFKEFQTLPILYRLNNPAIDDTLQVYLQDGKNINNFYSKHQNFCLYYNRYGKDIVGFSSLQNGRIFQSQQETLNWIKALVFGTYLSETTDTQYFNVRYPNQVNLGKNSYFSTFFQIEYETIANQMYRASKSIYPTNDKIVIDHQTNSFVDAYNQGNLEVQKANRLGNKNYMINSRYSSNYDNLMKISDFKDDNILYQVQYQIFNHHIEANGNGCKNYVLQNYFTGVQSKVRTWVNAKEEALIRHELTKIYCDVDVVQHIDSKYINDINKYGEISSVCYTGLKSGEELIKNVSIILPPYNNSYVLNLISRVIGNSLVFTTGFDDNYTISKYVSGIELTDLVQSSTEPVRLDGSPNSKVSNFGGVPLDMYKYVDDNGECSSIRFQFMQEVKIKEIDDDYLLDGDTINLNTSKNIFYHLLQMPKIRDVDKQNIRFEYVKDFYKDNREILMLSTQIEFNGFNENVYVTRYYVEKLRAINTSFFNQLKSYYSNDFIYGKVDLPNNKTLVSSSFEFEKVDNRCYKVSVSLSNPIPNNSSFYICDNATQNVLIAVKLNGDGTNISSFDLYFNILESRNKNIYDENQNVIGTI